MNPKPAITSTIGPLSRETGIRRQTQSRLGGLNARIAWMTVMGDEPVVLAATCPGAGAPEACPILERIHAEAGPPCCGHDAEVER